MGFLVSLFTRLSPLRNPLVYSLCTGGLSFGLFGDIYILLFLIKKNAEVTYQRMMSRIFEPLLEKTLQAYIDDMLVKSISHDDHLAHLRQAFHLMRLHQLRLNLDKCAFGIESTKKQI